MQISQLLQTPPSLTAEHTNPLLWGSHFQNQWHLVAARNNKNHPDHLKQNFESFSVDWCGCEVPSTPRLFYLSF
jgi:hypothetical protein